MLTKITSLSILILFMNGCTSTPKNDLAIEEAIQILNGVQTDQTFGLEENMSLRNAFIIVEGKRIAYVTINIIFGKETKEAKTYILKKDKNDIWQVDSVLWSSHSTPAPAADTFLPECKENTENQDEPEAQMNEFWWIPQKSEQ